MKTTSLSILTFLLSFTTPNVFAQIPNNGFEAWESLSTTNGSFEEPLNWLTTNFKCPNASFYPVRMSVDAYAISSTNNYSVKMQNNISLLPDSCALGFIRTCGLSNGATIYYNSKFPVTGHPSSLTGWYKFLPQGGDTMTIIATLYKSGAQISQGTFYSTVSAPVWTNLNVPFSAYLIADSASIFIGAYRVGGPAAQHYPHGNSVLYIDNLNLDNLTTGISDMKAKNKDFIFPNPFNTQTTIQAENVFNNTTLTIYNCLGHAVKEVKHISGQKFALLRENLPNGLYFVHLTEGSTTVASTKLVVTD